MPELHVVRVFLGSAGKGGNPLGVFLTGAEVPPQERQRVATELGFSETVFVDDPQRGEIHLFTPATELAFAGHPMVGTAWLLRRRGFECPVLRPPAGEVAVRHDGRWTWISGRPEWVPGDMDFIELGSPDEVDRLDGPPGERGAAFCWAWQDERTGRIRARGLYPSLGIAEDEATGAAAVELCARFRRPLEIYQGMGSLLLARPLDEPWVEVGGVTALDEAREFEL